MADKLVRIPIGLDDKQAREDAKKFVTDFEKEFLRLKKALADALAGGANDVKSREAIEELNATVSKAEESLKSFKAVASDTSGTDKLAQSADAASSNLSDVGDSASEAGKSLVSVGDIAKGAFAGIGVAAVAEGFMQLGQAALQFGSDSVAAFSSFETGFAQVKTLLPTLGEEGFSAMRQQLIDFSVEVGRTTEETLPALYQALSSGIPRENVFEFLQQANQAALAGVTDLESSVTLLSSIVNAYGSDTISVTEASDVLFGTARLGVTTFEEMSASLSAVTPIASSLNVPLSDIGAQLATITLSGTSTAEATTQMRAAMSELSDASSDASSVLKELTGLSFADFIDQGNSVGDAFNLLADYAEDTDQSISDLFGSTEAASAALVISGKGAESYANALVDLQDSTGDTELAALEFADTLELSKKKSDAALEAFKLQVGEGLQPLAKSYYETAASVLSYLTTLAEGDQGSMEALLTVDELDSAMSDLQRTMEDSGQSFEDFALAIADKNISDQFLSTLDQTKLKLYESQAALQLLGEGFDGTATQLAEAAAQQGLLQMQIDAGTTSLALQRDTIDDWTQVGVVGQGAVDALADSQDGLKTATDTSKEATASHILKVLEETDAIDAATLALLGKNIKQGDSLDSIGALIIDQGILTAKEWEYVSAIATAELKTSQLTGAESDWAAQIAANSNVISQNTALLLQNLAARNAISGSAAHLISLEGGAVGSAIARDLVKRDAGIPVTPAAVKPPPLVGRSSYGGSGRSSSGGGRASSGGSSGRSSGGSSGKSEAEKEAEATAKAEEKAEEERLKNEEKFNEKVIGINADILKIRMDNEDKVAELRTKNSEKLAEIDSKYNEDVAKQTTDYNRDVASKKLDIADDYYKAQLENERDLAKITDDENRKLADQKTKYSDAQDDLYDKAGVQNYEAQVDRDRKIADIKQEAINETAKAEAESAKEIAELREDLAVDLAKTNSEYAKKARDQELDYGNELDDLARERSRDIAKQQRKDSDEIAGIEKERIADVAKEELDALKEVSEQKEKDAKKLAKLQLDLVKGLIEKTIELEKEKSEAKREFAKQEGDAFLANLKTVVEKGADKLDVGGQAMQLLSDEVASGATAAQVGKLAEALGVADAKAVQLASSYTQLEEARQSIARADLSVEDSAKAFKDVTKAFEAGGDIDKALAAYGVMRQTAEEYAAEKTKEKQKEVEDFVIESNNKIATFKQEAADRVTEIEQASVDKVKEINDKAALDTEQVALDYDIFLRELDIKYAQDKEDALREHNLKLGEIDGELASERIKINQEANDDIKKAEEKLEEDKKKIQADSITAQTEAAEDYAEKLEDIDYDLKIGLIDAETNNARDIEKIHQDSLDAQDAANLAYKQKREDIAHDGTVALETMATNHNQKLVDLDAAKNKTIKDANDQLGRDIKAANDDMEAKVGEALGKLSGKFLGVKGDADAFKNELVNIGIAADNLSGKSVQIFFDYVERGTKVNAISPDPTNTNVTPKKPASSKVPANAFSLGGYTGTGSKDKVAGIVHADEFVLPSDVRKKGLASIIKFVESFDPQFNGSISKSLPNSLDTTVPMIKVPTMSNSAMRNDSPQFSQPSYNDHKNIFFYGYQAERMAQATIGMNRRQFINNLLGRK